MRNGLVHSAGAPECRRPERALIAGLPASIFKDGQRATGDRSAVRGRSLEIIIDAEALIRQRRSLAAEDFVKRSDAIGIDQRILRLRYGQFLGEESEGAPKPPPTSDLPTSDTPAAGDHDHDHDDEHDHGLR